MKNHSVKRGGAIAFAITFILALAMPLMAQEPKQYSNPVISGMLVISGQTSNMPPVYIDASRSQVISFSSQCLMSADDATNGAYFLAPSDDGINMDTNRYILIYTKPTTAAEGIYGWWSTNITVGAHQGYFVFQFTNGTSISSQTNSLKYSVKISSP